MDVVDLIEEPGDAGSSKFGVSKGIGTATKKVVTNKVVITT